MKFYPCNKKKRRWGQVKFLAIMKGTQTFFGVVLTQVLEVCNHNEGGGGTKGFHPLKMKGEDVLISHV